MALTMDALFKPLNDFFLSRFGSSDAGTIVFRFDKFGSKVSQDDFRMNPTDPNSPFSQAVAREKMSDLANRLPTDAGDGTSVAFLADTIDAIYEQLLRSSQPHLPPGTDAQRRKALIESFSSMKADALRLFEQAEMTSVSGAPLGFRLTDFSPGNWYDLASNEVWTAHSLLVKGEEQDEPALAPPLQWRVLPSDQRLQVLMRSLRPSVEERPTMGGPLRLSHVGVVRRSEVSSSQLQPLHLQRLEDTPQIMLKQGLVRFDVLDRLRFKEALVKSAEASQVTTSEVRISFEYSLVSMNRRWLRPSFLNAYTWTIPGQEPGAANQSGRPGSLTLLPLAFLAVRNLSIQASWSEADREVLKNAMSWGPFEVMPSVGSGSVAQPGLQIVGWMLQKVPPLPPRAVGEPAPSGGQDDGPRTYRVRSGDTLRKIATRFYGDPAKYVLIQRANNITNPDRISVGQVLKIPSTEGS